MPDPEALAKIAYEAYGQTTSFKNFRGEQMPKFENLGETIRRAWVNAAHAAAQAHVNSCSGKMARVARTD